MPKPKKEKMKVEMVRHELPKNNLDIKELELAVEKYLRTIENQPWIYHGIKKNLIDFIDYTKAHQ